MLAIRWDIDDMAKSYSQQLAILLTMLLCVVSTFNDLGLMHACDWARTIFYLWPRARVVS